MKRLMIMAITVFYGSGVAAQVKIGDNPATVNGNAILEIESQNKGFLPPRIALAGLNNPAPLSTHVAGMVVYNTAAVGDVAPGLYVNDGTRWSQLLNGNSAAGQTVEAVCVGFSGTYSAGEATRTFTVTFTNNSFGMAQVSPALSDLALTPASGLVVSAVSPHVATALEPGATLEVTYTLGGSITAPVGTVITATFAKLGLRCSKTVTVGNAVPVVNAGIAQTINIYQNTSVSFTGTATDTDGTIASYAWSRTGGTGTAPVAFTSPAAASTTITGINAAGTYIFRLIATDNQGDAGSATVTVTAIGEAPENSVFGLGSRILTFMPHNLGANTALDPHVPSQGINGNYYQWGRPEVAATAENGAIVPGWNTAPAAYGSWNSGTTTVIKTVNDPCPAGYRVPTRDEWVAATNAAYGNVTSQVGSWTNSGSNFSAALRISTGGILKITLPAAGYRIDANGGLNNRGFWGSYWSSTENSAAANRLLFGSNFVAPANSNARMGGFSIRCVKE